jgi:SAM-dependent methyltransferase
MLADVESGGCVRPQLGDVTDSGLPDASIDLVVCARVIEYLFWPDCLADEICRIARPGATYFVTFPANRGEEPPRDGPPPDRVRHYFSADEIQRWAARIGRGRLVGVQYERAEPKDQAAERRYRAAERSAPAGVRPTNWAFIGQVGDTGG